MTIAIETSSAIVVNATGQSGSTGGASVALQAQLDRCTKQLGDWVNCSSGKTQEGKQIIQALQEKISTIKAQIQSRQAQGAHEPNSNQSNAGGSSTGGSTIVAPASLALAPIGSLGTLLNTVA
jgi:hypothetical protein